MEKARQYINPLVSEKAMKNAAAVLHDMGEVRERGGRRKGGRKGRGGEEKGWETEGGGRGEGRRIRWGVRASCNLYLHLW